MNKYSLELIQKAAKNYTLAKDAYLKSDENGRALEELAFHYNQSAIHLANLVEFILNEADENEMR